MAFCPVCRSDFPDDWRKCPRDDVVLLASDTIGKYRILGLIGSGGMGAVYRAENPDTKGQVAIKLLHPQASGLDNARERFRREAATVAKLSTRHVVTIHDFGSDDRETLYLIMELLAGHPLREEIRQGTVPIMRLGLIINHSLRGLSSAHKAGVTHRDLKPENIFVARTDDGEVVKLLDFGIARDVSAATGLTHSGTLMGTPAYMAPEQITASRGIVGPATDVYAMGAIIYEMLTGNAPFAADSVSAVLGRILEREFAPMRDVRDDLPDSVYRLIDRALSDSPEERFASAGAMLEDWRGAWNDFDSKLTSGEVPEFVPPEGKVRSDHSADPHSDTDIAASAKTAAATPAPPGELTPELAETAALPGNDRPEPDTQSTSGGRLFVTLGVGGLVAAAAATLAVVMWPDNPAPVVASADATAARPADATPAEPSIDAGPPAIEGMTYFAGGRITLGTPKNLKDRANPLPERTVEVKPFYIDRMEVTAAGSRLPLTNVSFEEAKEQCSKRGKRLPTEEEWELVARSDELDPEGACLRGGQGAKPAPVGTHNADCTDTGVCDLIGNVSEWVEDGWLGDSNPDKAIARGSAFSVAYIPGSFYSSIFARLPVARDKQDREIGFRCAKSVVP